MAERTHPAQTELSAPFWEAAANGRLVLQACECGSRIFPPRVVCPDCWSQDLRWTEASGRGEVYCFSVLHRPPTEDFADRVPYVVALVTLDEGPRMMTNVVGCDPGELTVGMRVRVLFADGDGPALPLFEPERQAR